MSKFVQQIRKPSARDANYIYDLDLKCYDNQWSKENWTSIHENPQASTWVGCYNQVPISFLVLEYQSFVLPDKDQRVKSLHIHKICVKEVFRHKGVGMQLLAFIHQKAIQQVGVGWVTMTVPEWFVNPKEPRNCLGWLQKYKFEALTTLPETIPLYGRNYDQYFFGFQLK